MFAFLGQIPKGYTPNLQHSGHRHPAFNEPPDHCAREADHRGVGGYILCMFRPREADHGEAGIALAFSANEVIFSALRWKGSSLAPRGHGKKIRVVPKHVGRCETDNPGGHSSRARALHSIIQKERQVTPQHRVGKVSVMLPSSAPVPRPSDVRPRHRRAISRVAGR